MTAKLSLIVLILCTMNLNAQVKIKPIPVIFDTDIATDYDDVGAITLLHYYADQGKATILATIASSKYPRVAAVLSVFNTYFKMPDVPIGVPGGKASDEADPQRWSNYIVSKYPHKIKSNKQALDAVKLYRKVLAKQPDNTVTLITVGFFTNIANLLKSGPDEYSSLTGQELVNRKVLKLVSMAGKFPSGSEFNMDEDSISSKYVFSHWTKEVIFSGFEIGEKILTGLPLIHNEKIVNDPVKDIFRISIPQSPDDIKGRKSWDETAVFVAINGPGPYYRLIAGKIKLNVDGSNTWSTSGNQFYIDAVRPPAEMQNLINQLIMHQPK